MAAANLIEDLYSARPADGALFIKPDGQVVNTAKALSHIAALSAGLRAEGVVAGDRVSVKLPKSVEGILLAHAVLHAGGILHPLNDTYTDSEIAALLADAEPAVMVCDPAEADRLGPLAARAGATLRTYAPGGGTIRPVRDAPATASLPAGHDGAALLYTSGTTGKPKGALITHRNLIGSARSLAGVWDLGPRDVLLHALPIYHAHGLLTSINTLLAAGGAIRLLDRFDPRAVLTALSRTTLMMGVPTHYARLLAEPALADAIGPGFRLAISGSSALPTALGEEFRRITGVPLLERYGSTEAAIIAAVPPDCDDRPGWVGWPLPDVEVRVHGTGGENARTGIGELETRGPHVFAGYWNNPPATREAFTADGWFRTGDIAEIDDTGCVRILGRSRDLVITGGLNVYPAEVENALTSLPGVAAAAVFGVPHPDFGEAVVAAVEVSPGTSLDEKATITALREQLAAYKTPKRILSVEAIPRNAMGKITKPALRDAFVHLFETGA
mgnify:CR=1 FL=1